MSSDPYYDFYSEIILNDPLFDRFRDNYDLIDMCEELEFNDNVNIKQCPITLLDFKEKEKIIKLPCDHIFSKNSIIEWFKEHTNCPLCRFNLVNQSNSLELNNQQTIEQQIDSIIEHLSNRLLSNNSEENVYFEIY
tara:strand:- start:381 stop:788 length:408 start_codon:yes stop_codon:yes gene_type:complete